ncbi:TIGR00341 family protein [Spectribacter hydrogenoxidans]|uniref:TIGR00341 family protein n=1 Tax=Spectribacter hydrogenoxidans TaxID=3075608 RepID=A0ABU3BYK2_9GAMM|nr:TIGR00341 family protein [Salinisphaera sp. W335]MDT0634382.1 TIGR00341 family protein [Salinisphaera sp. W335]
MRLIEITVPAGDVERVTELARAHEVLDCWWPQAGGDRLGVRILVYEEQLQELLDALQGPAESRDWRIMLQMPEAVLPREEADKPQTANGGGRSREELFHEVERGARMDLNFFLLTGLSAIVAAIGMVENNVAVVIGAMVIAPLLGPNIALALGASLGDRQLMTQALAATGGGLVLAGAIAFVLGLIMGGEFEPVVELTSRTDVGPAGVAMALASGAAAVLSLTTGVSAALVGVMVAVALLPPVAAVGLMLSAADWPAAAGAALLLAVNIVCVNLAANLVFRWQGVRPRCWIEARAAQQSGLMAMGVWLVCLIVLSAVIGLRMVV